VALHTTFYVARPFPSHVKPGQVLEESDYHYLRGLLSNRDGLIQVYQELLILMQAKHAHAKLDLARRRPQFPALWISSGGLAVNTLRLQDLFVRLRKRTLQFEQPIPRPIKRFVPADELGNPWRKQKSTRAAVARL
jgi:hypothetical protein